MYEEFVMDKKQSSNRSSQPQSKGFGAEGKKGQDVANKPWPRGNGGSRRREPSGASFSIKNEPSRKPIPQRNKIVLDKRPKPRGGAAYYAGSGLGGKEDARLTVNQAELGSVFVQGSKKQSLNHLLNFHYTPRQNLNNYDGGVCRSLGGYRMQNGFKHKYNKEEFLQATCQFVVNAEGNYELNLKDPDALVNWDLIEQVHVQGSEFPSCPICLYLPVAAKMTRCGHIYCWSCLLHYLALSDKNWRKCPICFEAIHKQDLKSAIAKPFANINVGDMINMKLMRRERGSLISVPVSELEYRQESNNMLLKISEKNINTSFSKLLLADNEEVLQIVDRERNELNIQLSEDENCPEKCFIDQALELLLIREQAILQKASNVCKSDNNQHNELKIQCYVENKNLEVSESSEESAPSKYFYFYQASDGQHIYLHSLNIRILEHMYGNLENCPPMIEGVIVEKETDSITDEVRKRKRYLQHLPVTCQFEVAELEIKSPIIKKDVLDCFKDQIDHRRKRRQKRARDERRHEKRIIEKENRLMGKYPAPNIHIESYHQFPTFIGSPTDQVPVGIEFSSPPLSANSVAESSTSLTESIDRSLSSEDLSEFTNLQLNEPTKNIPSGPSFATMLTKSKIETVSWPALNSANKKESTSSPKLISVTGRNCRIGFDVKHQQFNDSDSEQAEGYVPAPAFNQSFSEAIASALEQSAKQVCSDENPPTTIDEGNCKKKKKRNRKLLFATSMACTGK